MVLQTGEVSTGEDDVTVVTVSTELTAVDDSGLCVIGEASTVSKDFTLNGRLQVTVRGQIVDSECLTNSDLNCADAGMNGAEIEALVSPCHAETTVCVETSPLSMLNCNQVIEFGVATCNDDAGQHNEEYAGMTVGELCSIVCATCGASDSTLAYDTADDSGFFEITVVFGPADLRGAADGESFVVIMVTSAGKTSR